MIYPQCKIAMHFGGDSRTHKACTVIELLLHNQVWTEITALALFAQVLNLCTLTQLYIIVLKESLEADANMQFEFAMFVKYMCKGLKVRPKIMKQQNNYYIEQ